MSSTSNQPHERMTVRFHGHVQGVGFRYTTVKIAEDLPITGYVMNQPDGTVELAAEGKREDCLKLLRLMQDSHIHRYVTRQDVSWSTAHGTFDGFRVRYA